MVEVEYRCAGAAALEGTADVHPGPGNHGLRTTSSYELEAFSLDEAGTRVRTPSTATGAPVLTEGFYARYRVAGGAEAGGCSTGGAELLSPLALAVLATLSRRKRG